MAVNVLRWIFMTWNGAWTGMIWLRIGTGGGALETVVMHIRVP